MSAWLDGFSSVTIILIGCLLMSLGVIAVAFGVAGGIAKMIKDLRNAPKASSTADPFKSLQKLAKALTEFLRALGKAPVWLALVFVGFALVIGGALLTSYA